MGQLLCPLLTACSLSSPAPEAGGGDLDPGTFHIQISFGELSLSFHFDKLNRGVRF